MFSSFSFDPSATESSTPGAPIFYGDLSARHPESDQQSRRRTTPGRAREIGSIHFHLLLLLFGVHIVTCVFWRLYFVLFRFDKTKEERIDDAAALLSVVVVL